MDRAQILQSRQSDGYTREIHAEHTHVVAAVCPHWVDGLSAGNWACGPLLCGAWDLHTIAPAGLG